MGNGSVWNLDKIDFKYLVLNGVNVKEWIVLTFLFNGRISIKDRFVLDDMFGNVVLIKNRCVLDAMIILKNLLNGLKDRIMR
jgi:hypothetical protein